jgi:hypothetical protein
MATPYLKVQEPRIMKGEGAPRDTVFGVLGRTMYDSKTKSLGGLVQKTTDVKTLPVAQSAMRLEANGLNTDRHILGHKAATPAPGQHSGQVPYAGYFKSVLGSRL